MDSKKYKLKKELWVKGKSKFFVTRMYQEGLWKRGGKDNTATIGDLYAKLGIKPS